MTTRRPGAGEGGDDVLDTVDAERTTLDSDSTIIEGRGTPAIRGLGGALLPVAVGADVYSSDGDLVATVEVVSDENIGVRAGQPGRSIVVPASGIAHVSSGGRRVDLYALTENVRSLSSEGEPGSKHLEAQQPDTLARDSLPGAESAPQPSGEEPRSPHTL
jgi:hypothetical protein